MEQNGLFYQSRQQVSITLTSTTLASIPLASITLTGELYRSVIIAPKEKLPE
jgi:hypothetical protein